MTTRTRTARIPFVLAVTALGVFALAPAPMSTAAQSPSQPVPEPGVCQGCQPPLVYHGGPVMGTNGLTITPIYWAPDGYSFPSSYTTIVNQYISDIAADSGGSNNTYAITAEYYQQQSGQQASITYKITAGSPLTVNDPFPSTANPCSVEPPYNACVNSDQIQTELGNVISANNLSADMNNLYVLLFPQGVQTFETNARSMDVYCGVHQSFQLPNGVGTAIYADEPYISAQGCMSGQAPNGDPAADSEVGVMSHEIIEAMTDPVGSSPSWYDQAGNEIGDECNFNFGPPLGSADSNNPQTTEYNQVINGHNYYTQTIFSNAAYSADGVGKGCIATAFNSGGAAPSPSTTAYKTDSSDSPTSAEVVATDQKLPADGTSTTTVTYTELDDSGEPVSGDHVHFGVDSSDVAEGACGTLSSADGTTDDNGEVQTTYTASKADAACMVIGVDAESGASDWDTIYQGSADDDQPGITDTSVPQSITPGGGVETFSVTATNPSKDDLEDARFDIVITGDDNGSTGVTSSQVHIAYSDDTTGGKFQNIPASGETTKDGEIDADAMPDSDSTLAAGASRTVTFQISLDGNAPTSSATGQPLHIETDFDQVDPADGSTNNLDYAGPSDVTIGGGSGGGGLGLPIIIVIIAAVVVVLGAGILVFVRRRPRTSAA